MKAPLKEILSWSLLFLRQKEDRLSCEIQRALLLAWANAIQEFSNDTSAWTAGIGTTSKTEFQDLRGRAELARLGSENASLAVGFHRHEHGC